MDGLLARERGSMRIGRVSMVPRFILRNVKPAPAVCFVQTISGALPLWGVVGGLALDLRLTAVTTSLSGASC